MFSGKAWDCRKCTQTLSRLRNCKGNTNPGFRVTVGREVLRRCPSSLISSASWAFVRKWQRYKLFGAGLWEGGPARAPEFVIQAMECIEAEVARIAEEEGRSEAG